MRFDEQYLSPIKRAIEAAESAHLTPILVRLESWYQRGLVGPDKNAPLVCGVACDPTSFASHIQCAPQHGEETAAKLYLASFMTEPKTDAKTSDKGAQS